MTQASEVIGRPDDAGRQEARLGLALLVVGLVALALGAGAVGWAIGHGTSAAPAAAVAAAPPPAAAAAPASKGNATAGRAVFVGSGCGSCHALAETKATGTVGPNLDQVTLTESQILDWVGKGKGAMPSFKGRLTDKELGDLAAFLAQAEKAG